MTELDLKDILVSLILRKRAELPQDELRIPAITKANPIIENIRCPNPDCDQYFLVDDIIVAIVDIGEKGGTKVLFCGISPSKVKPTQKCRGGLIVNVHKLEYK